MAAFNELPKGYCQAFGGEALFGATASHCREINGCTAADCPLERDGKRPEEDLAAKLMAGPFVLMSMGRSMARRR